MRRRTYIERTGLVGVGLSGLLAGCLGSDDANPVDGGTDGSGDGDGNDAETTDEDGATDDDGDGQTGTLATSVTDLPGDIGDFESCIVTITGAYVLPGSASGGGDDVSEPEERDDEGEADDDRDGSEATGDDDGGDDDGSGRGGPADDHGGGRRYVEFEEPQEADLVDLQGTNTQLVDEREFEVGSYGGLHLEVEGVRGTLADGERADVDTPGDAGLKFPEAFEVREGERTTFVADFTPVRRGRTNRYLIRPVATGTAVLYGDEEYDGGENDDVDDAFYELDDSDSDQQGDGSDDPDYRPGDDGDEGDDD